MPVLTSARGPAREAAGRVVTPIAQTLAARAPAGLGALVWNRPLGVEVLEGTSRRFVRIVDHTRRIQWVLLGAGLVVGFLLRRRR